MEERNIGRLGDWVNGKMGRNLNPKFKIPKSNFRFLFKCYLGIVMFNFLV
jgi:hypothetical protein